MTVKLGICANRNQIEAIGRAIVDLGPDWLDLSVLDGCLSEFADSIPAATGLGAYRAISVEEKVETIDHEVLGSLARYLIASVAETRATALTFGSGDFRTWLYKLAHGNAEKTRRNLTEFTAHLACLSADAGIQLLIEPLNESESPVWNSLEECSSDLVGVPVGFVADRQHTWGEVQDHAAALAKVQVAHVGGPNRSVPLEIDVPGLIETAISMPNVDRILWECRWRDPSEVEMVLTSSRRALAQMGGDRLRR